MTRKNNQLHSNKGGKSVLKDKSDGQLCPTQQRQRPESDDITAMYISSNSVWRKQVCVTNKPIHWFNGDRACCRQNMFTSQTWHFWWAYSSGHVGPKWQDFIQTFPLVELDLNWELCWWWQVFKTTKHFNDQVGNKKVYSAKCHAAHHKKQRPAHSKSLVSKFQRPLFFWVAGARFLCNLHILYTCSAEHNICFLSTVRQETKSIKDVLLIESCIQDLIF